MKKTITRAEIVNAIHNRVGLSRTEAYQILQEVLDEIINAAVAGETVKIANFATFHVRDKRVRLGRNPKTGEPIPIVARRVMTFKASKILKEDILEANSKG